MDVPKGTDGGRTENSVARFHGPTAAERGERRKGSRYFGTRITSYDALSGSAIPNRAFTA